jgi:hypothetical protein
MNEPIKCDETLFSEIENHGGVHTWSRIIIHHSATKDGNTNDWDSIKLWHTGQIGSSDSASVDYNPYVANKMQDIGYHSGLEFVNGRLVYRYGRSLEINGAHTIGQNHEAIGICVVGNFDLIEPSHQHYFMLACLCRAYMRRYGIPIQNVGGHNYFADKTCPGRRFDLLKLKYDYII